MRGLWRRYSRIALVIKIGIALVLGVAAGLLLNPDQVAWLDPLGDLLLQLLKFLILPIILGTVIVGINQTSVERLGDISVRLVAYYLATTAIAMVIGLMVALLLQPGRGLTLPASAHVSIPDNAGVIHVLLEIVPKNIVSGFAQLNLLAIIFTATVFGLAIIKLRDSSEHAELGEQLYRVIAAFNEATMLIMRAVLQFVPIGIFAIVAGVVAKQGSQALVSLGDMIGVFYLGLACQLLFYTLLLVVFGVGLPGFFRHARTPMLTAFATQSSSGTLPLTLTAAARMGLPQSVYGVTLPLGATINMDGAAMRIAISAVFAANVVDVSLSWMQLVQIVIIGTLASVGTAGVPGAGIVMIATVFTQVGLPIETVALLTSIDTLVGMGATAINVTGDLVGAAVIGGRRRVCATVRPSKPRP